MTIKNHVLISSLFLTVTIIAIVAYVMLFFFIPLFFRVYSETGMAMPAWLRFLAMIMQLRIYVLSLLVMALASAIIWRVSASRMFHTAERQNIQPHLI
ncbi:MAG: hypothetical protein JW715_13820 [Sedimentisphaerales bacterium]|nr:hypothetical protein [Sedimentisphaerales bacterium]